MPIFHTLYAFSEGAELTPTCTPVTYGRVLQSQRDPYLGPFADTFVGQKCFLCGDGLLLAVAFFHKLRVEKAAKEVVPSCLIWGYVALNPPVIATRWGSTGFKFCHTTLSLFATSSSFFFYLHLQVCMVPLQVDRHWTLDTLILTPLTLQSRSLNTNIVSEL